MTTDAQIVQLLQETGEYYNTRLSSQHYPAYCQALRRFDFDRLKAARDAHYTDTNAGQFFPKIADFMRQLEFTRRRETAAANHAKAAPADPEYVAAKQHAIALYLRKLMPRASEATPADKYIQRLARPAFTAAALPPPPDYSGPLPIARMVEELPEISPATNQTEQEIRQQHADLWQLFNDVFNALWREHKQPNGAQYGS